jgi:hypothetical protein
MLRRLSTWAIVCAALACGKETGPLKPTDSGTSEPDPDAGIGEPDASTPDTGTTPGNDDVETLDLGTLMTGANGEVTATFDLPEGVVSFMVLIAGETDTLYIVKKLDGPDGVIVSDDPSNVSQIEMLLLGPFAAQFKGPNRVVQDTGLAAALFPNNPHVTVRGGSYSMVITGLTLSGQNGTPYVGPVDVSILYRTVAPTSGKLDVNLYFSGASGITAATAPDDPLIQGALTELAAIYSQASITLGSVSYHDVDARFSTITISLDGAAGPLEEMFALTEGNGAGLSFFFIERFEGGFPGAMVAGIAGGLPGPPLSTGSTNSGVAVAFAPAAGDPKILAHVMAHEGGHWLGLFHTSEITGTADQLDDTPDGMAGNTFLMYPAVGGGTTISPSQGNVLLNHIETVRN